MVTVSSLSGTEYSAVDIALSINPLTAGAAYIRVLIFYYQIKYQI